MGDSELSATNLLTTKQVADGFNDRMLVVEVWLKMQLHRQSSGAGSTLSEFPNSCAWGQLKGI